MNRATTGRVIEFARAAELIAESRQQAKLRRCSLFLGCVPGPVASALEIRWPDTFASAAIDDAGIPDGMPPIRPDVLATHRRNGWVMMFCNPAHAADAQLRLHFALREGMDACAAAEPLRSLIPCQE